MLLIGVQKETQTQYFNLDYTELRELFFNNPLVMNMSRCFWNFIHSITLNVTVSVTSDAVIMGFLWQLVPNKDSFTIEFGENCTAIFIFDGQ